MKADTDQSPDAHDTAKRERQKAGRAERLEAHAAEQRRAQAQGRALRLVIVVVGLLLVGALGYLAVQGDDTTLGVAAATGQDDLPALVPATGGGVADIAVGAQVPVIAGQDFDGASVGIGEPGQAQAVVFLAHWCPHCQDEMPLIGDWVQEGLLPEDVELVGVSTYQDPARPNWPPDDWFEREGFPGRALVDSSDAAGEAWGLSGTPMWVFTDDTGTVVARYTGEITSEQFAEGAALVADGSPA